MRPSKQSRADGITARDILASIVRFYNLKTMKHSVWYFFPSVILLFVALVSRLFDVSLLSFMQNYDLEENINCEKLLSDFNCCLYL